MAIRLRGATIDTHKPNPGIHGHLLRLVEHSQFCVDDLVAGANGIGRGWRDGRSLFKGALQSLRVRGTPGFCACCKPQTHRISSLCHRELVAL